ncbi:alpha/beta hydrolase, partial [Faecalibacterium prausnitzii]|nr:alpha/beta hydrolase [Faecalibacterium prausnitzii]
SCSARQYLCEYGRELNGAIIMGTGFQPKALVKVAKTLCRVLAAFHGWHYRCSLVANLSFIVYNMGLEGRTTHDW